jgi:hypothetical protein
VSDPARDIADALVAFTADPSRGYSRAFESLRPKHPGKELKAEVATWRLLAIPVGEIEEKESRSRVFLQPQVNVVVMGPAEGDADHDAGADLVREIRRSLRFESMAGWTWQRSETITKYDPELMAKETFLSAFTLTYAGVEA